MTDADSWHEQRKARPLPELMFTIDELERGQGMSRRCGVVEAVITAASDGHLALDRCLRNDGVAVGEPVNAWELLRDFIEKYKSGTLEDDDDPRKWTPEQHRLAYLACKGTSSNLSALECTCS